MAKKKRGSDASSPGRRRPAPGAEREAPDVPTWVPWVLYTVLGVALFREFVFSDLMLEGGDTLSLGLVARAFYHDALANGIFPLWAPRILGGTPFVDALSGGDSLYPPSVLLLMLLDTHRALGWKLVVHVVAAGLLTWLWVRSLGASKAAALVAGAGYMLAPMLIGFVAPGHDGKLFVMTLAPLMFWAVERFFAREHATAGGFAAIGLVVALVISTTHFQMAYFLFLAVGCYAFFRAIQMARGTERGVPPEAVTDAGVTAGAAPDQGREGLDARDTAPDPAASGGVGSRAAARGFRPASLRFGLFLAASIAGALGAAVQLVPAVQYVTEYSRRTQTTDAEAGETGLAWSSSYSIHPEEVMSLLVPQFAGNNAGGAAWAEGTYWGRNGFKDNHENPVLLLLVLAAVAFAGGRRRGVRWFMAGLGGVALLFALGVHTPVWRIFYEVVPGIRLFRAPSQAMFLFVFAATTLGALGVDRLLRRDPPSEVKGEETPLGSPAFVVLLAATGVMALLMVLASSGGLTSAWTGGGWPGGDPMRLRMVEALRPHIARGAFVGFALVAALTGGAWAFRTRKIGGPALVAGLVVLVAVDGFRVDTAFIRTMDYYAWAQPDPVVGAILEQEAGSDEPYRLFSMVRRGQDVDPTLHGIEMASGHHPNDLARYRELIGMVGSTEPRTLFHENVRKILNVKYILWPDYERNESLGGQPLARTQLQDGRTYQSLYPDIGLPRARLVGQAVEKSDAEAVAYILSDAHDPEREVVLADDASEGGVPGGVAALDLAAAPVTGAVDWVERSPNRLVLDVRSSGPALLVVADNWFPAWNATVGGEEAPVLRAYHTVRAVPVPAGTSRVVMTYESAVLARSAWVSALVLLGLAVAGLQGVLSDRRRLFPPRAAAPDDAAGGRPPRARGHDGGTS